MKKYIEKVRDFHQAFGIPGEVQPKIPDEERKQLRYKLMREELEEFKVAADRGDLVEVADALTDLQYVLFGTVLEFGLQEKFEVLFLEVQRSNMSKLGKDGKPIYREDGKVMKGPDWSPPALKQIIEN